MKINKLKYIITIMALVIIMGLNVQTVHAASGSVKASGGGTVKVGDTVSVTFSVNADETMYAIEFGVSYDPKVLDFTGGSSANGDGGTIKVASTADSNKKSFTLNFKAKQPGTSSISVSDAKAVGADLFQLSASGTSVTVAAPVQHSKDNSLKSLKVSPGTLSPAFNPSTTKYTVTVPNSTKKLSVDAAANHSAAKVVSVTGADSLSVGTNDVKIVVQAEDGSKATYTITVTREKAAAAPTTAPTAPTPTVTPTPSPTPEPELPPIEVKADDKPLFIESDFESSAMPESFRKETMDYADREITVAVSNDGDLTLVYLIEENKESGDFFIYNKDTDSFSPYNEIEGSGGRYIIIPLEEGVTIPDTFIETSFTFEGNEIGGWQLTGLEDEEYYIVYAMDGKGSKGLYNFDLKEVTFQRFSIDALNALLSDDSSDEDQDLIAIKDDLDKTNENLTKLQSKYNLDMSSRLKIIVSLAVVSTILLVLLVNVLLRNRFLKQDLLELEEYVGDYDKAEEEFNHVDNLDASIDDFDFTGEFAASKEESNLTFKDVVTTSPQDEIDAIFDQAMFDDEDQKPIKEVKESSEVEKTTYNKKKDRKVKDLENASLEDIFEFLNVDELDDEDMGEDLI